MKLTKIACLLVGYSFFFVFSHPVFSHSGCCSSHGGVCGNQCCDGTALSAICATYYPAASSVNSSSFSWPQVVGTIFMIIVAPILIAGIAGVTINVFSKIVGFIWKLIKKLLS